MVYFNRAPAVCLSIIVVLNGIRTSNSFFRMELMNKELLKLTKEWDSASAFKQDPRLATAIDKLYRSNVQVKHTNVSDLILPERKLDFYELQNLLKNSSEDKGTFYCDKKSEFKIV